MGADTGTDGGTTGARTPAAADLVADPPRWALAEGILEPPTEGERFRAYWLRHGFTDADVDRALDGLTEQTLPLAHARIGAVLIDRERERFDVHVASRLLAAGGRRHDWIYGAL